MLNKLNDKSLLFISVLSLLSVVIALVAQHKFNMQPCAWCILQRFLFVVIVFLSLMFFFAKKLQKTGYSVISMLAGFGMFSAIYQYFIASKSFDCSTSFAEKIIAGLQLNDIFPNVFGIYAMCADAQPEMFGIPFVFFSFLLFLLISNLTSLLLILEFKKHFGKN